MAEACSRDLPEAEYIVTLDEDEESEGIEEKEKHEHEYEHDHEHEYEKDEPCEEACARGNDNKKRKHEDVFKEGTLIEVHPVEEGFEGAWFSAKVIHALEEETYLVRYKKLRTDDNRDFLIEEVHKNNIRPYPSEHIVIDGFRRHDKVDGFCNDGWWEGIISKVYAGGRYKVYFESTNEEMVFDYTDLRLHTHWVNGSWYDFLSLISNFLPSIMLLYISFPFLGYDLYVSFIGALNLLHLLNLMACLDVILLEVV